MDRQRMEREKISPKVWPKGRKERGIAIKNPPYWVSSKEGTYPVKTETCPLLLKPHIHSCNQVQSVAKLTSISRSWPSKSIGASRYKVFSTYIMQGAFIWQLPATLDSGGQ